ncbi:MAG: pyridoxamine 5'-phosphate oxidase family protein [Defluviitaleaceae bacterium]|nr:pyridoxamine 5'-phosphate oxidase family protein [Defluviitaleaceae bacterium]
MHQDIIARAGDVINSRSDYIGEGMDGYVVLSLIDENGYPTSSTVTISKADGVNWMTFIGDIDGNKEKRIRKCSKASVCLASNNYNITLVGTMEILTDPAVKKEHWQKVFQEAYNANYDNPQYCILRFNTEHYNLFFADNDIEARGTL